jgi:hypothetical protein
MAVLSGDEQALVEREQWSRPRLITAKMKMS